MRRCIENDLQLAMRLNANGLPYEKLCADILQSQGFNVAWDESHSIWETDLTLAPDIPIEVKGSVKRPLSPTRQGYQFLIYKAGRSRRIREPITICLCAVDLTRPSACVPFIIPTSVIGNRHILAIQGDPLRYSGMWAQYRNNFALLEKAGARKGATLTCQLTLA